MLVITRKRDQEVVIGDPENPVAVVKVVSVRGKTIRLGVSCKRDIPVNRREVATDIIERRMAGGQGDTSRP